MRTFEMRHCLELGSASYPPAVAELSAAPKRLYVRGDITALVTPCISIIGARRATPYRIAVAEMAARVSAQSGLTVVSGGARGCDQAAGRAALDAGGRHVIVVGCGADVVYPRSLAPLIDDALQAGGAVVSLDPWGSPVRKYAFPRRNRVIAALSRALFVTEAGLPSGTFSTAEAALELDREVLAVPGSILSDRSRGTNHLISTGATCMVDEESLEMAISRIYGVLRYCRPDAAGVDGLDEHERAVLEAVIANPLRLEELAGMLRIGPVDALHLIGSMVVAGAVEQLADGRYAPTASTLHRRSRIGVPQR